MMEFWEQMAVIAIGGIVTFLMRALPFAVFRDGDRLRPGIEYLGYALPAALFAMLVVYCLRDVEFTGGTYGVPELVSIAFTALVHLKWRHMVVSLVGGTAFYMFLTYTLSVT